MIDFMMVFLKISLVVFMAGNLLDMGLRLNPGDAFGGLKNIPFVAHTLIWSFVVCPALALVITRIFPLEPPYAMGLLLMGMAPCAPFLPMIVSKAKGDIGFTAAFMLLTAVGTIVFMPFAVPLMVKGLSVSALTIAMPLVIVILLPLIVGMGILRVSQNLAAGMQPIIRKVTGISMIMTMILCLLVYGKGLLGLPGSLAIVAQTVFFLVVSTCPYWFGFGLRSDQKIVLCAGISTRNIGAAVAPLLSGAQVDQRAIVMVILGLPMMALFGMLVVKWFGPSAVKDKRGGVQ